MTTPLYELIERPADADTFARCVEFQCPMPWESGEYWLLRLRAYYLEHTPQRAELKNVDGEYRLYVTYPAHQRFTEIRLRRLP